MTDQLKLDLVFTIHNKNKDTQYAMGIRNLSSLCSNCGNDRLIKMLFDSGMQTAIIEVNKLINKKESDGKIPHKRS